MNTTRFKKPRTRKNTQTWYLVTNYHNLLYMLADGLVMEPAGFGEKYYQDSLSTMPGWIPLFRNEIPAQALEQATRERKHLRPCVISFDLSDISGPVQMLSRKGRLSDANFPPKQHRYAVLFIRVPLPLNLISRISFRSVDDLQAFEMAAGDVSNVGLSPYQIVVDEALFSNATDAVWPPAETIISKHRDTKEPNYTLFPDESKDPPQGSEAKKNHPFISTQALGGLLAMLYHSANRSDLGVRAFRLATGLSGGVGGFEVCDRILAELPKWLGGGRSSASADFPTKLYWGTLEALGNERKKNGSAQPVEIVLGYLDHQLASLAEEKFRKPLEGLIAEMRGCLGLGGGTITEVFERNKGSLSRSLLLFCLRKHCSDLLEFSHPLLSDAEYLLASILFGVRDGWLGLPREMRHQELCPYVMYRMACFAHQSQEGGLTLPAVPSPQPLRALFPCGAESWSETQIKAAIEISQASEWKDCIYTVITSADGSLLTDPTKQEDGSFIFSVDTTSTKKVRPDAFLKHLEEWPPIGAKLESKIRNDLNSVRNEETDQA